MVLYFSGTGNSQFVAIQLAEIIKDEVVSINSYLKNGKRGSFQSEKPLVFVAPTYSWRMPKVVEQWILAADFQGNRNTYFILTCGDSCGNAAVYAEKLCVKKGLQFCGLSPVLMPENYLAMFPTPSEAECLRIVEKSKPCVAALAGQIQSAEPFNPLSVSFAGKLESGPVNPLFYRFFVQDKGFTVSDDCISCKKCAQRCPLNNVELKSGKPVWKGHCTHCMACIGGCPTKAIEYKSKSKGQHRHYIMNDSLCWGNGGRDH
ncbi:flavodoxin [Aminipila butyrica]|uniref:Flavodoxin n=1 Tax=Aminipila butyrica TaxID=433296 RepID=A0A858BWS7_9FIRM|nr:EFR1 family ferrodoxin [Aminipila butyrica]QIB68536.1 flavodoxin [Aminipila butyrica]